MTRTPSLMIAQAPAAFEELALRACGFSNMQFAWQMYRCDPALPASPAAAREIVDTVARNPELHSFLLLAAREPRLTVEPLHEHAHFVEAKEEMERTLARAATNRLGAYSPMGDATPEAIAEVRRSFESLGSHGAFELRPGTERACTTCQTYNGHLFSDWFEGVAWDWCFCVIWESQGLAWIGCLTDTD